MTQNDAQRLVKSKQRVADHGAVGIEGGPLNLHPRDPVVAEDPYGPGPEVQVQAT